MTACPHDWVYFPTLATNPERRSRECQVCGLIQRSDGVTVLVDGATLPATDWVPEEATEVVA